MSDSETSQQEHAGDVSPVIERLCKALPPIGAYRFEFSSPHELHLSEFMGSALRGLFGRGLKCTACVTRMEQCGCCLLQSKCAYPLLFETPAAAVGETRPRFATPAHPFALSAAWGGDTRVAADASFDLGMQVFGRANDLLPYIINAMKLAGELGIGSGRQPFVLRRVDQFLPESGALRTVYVPGGRLAASGGQRIPVPPPRADAIDIELLTPLRLKRNGRLVGPGDLDARQFLTALQRRADALCTWFGDPVEPIAREALTRLAEGIEITGRSLEWADWTRYSSRQKTSMQMGGLLGGFILRGAAVAALSPLLEMGQWFHLGKGTSMGLGRYRVKPAASLPERTPAQDP